MRFRNILVISAILAMPQVFAADQATSSMSMSSDSDSKPCLVIVKACKAAGYKRKDDSKKRFWADCMKPILLGQTVDKVTVKPEDVQACKTDKIAKLQQMLNDLQGSSSNDSQSMQ